MKAEIGLRWLVAGLAVLASGWTGVVPFGLGLGVAIGWAALTGGLIALRDRQNPGIAGFVAALDSLAIFIVLSAADRLGSVGWIGLLPTLDAVHRYQARITALCAINAGQILGVHALIHREQPAPLLYIQVAGVLTCGWLLQPRSPIVAPAPEVIGSTDPLGNTEPESFLALRESFRKLRTMYRNLERQGRRDRVNAKLLEARLADANFATRLSDRFKEAVGADKALLYVAAEDGSGFVPRASSGMSTPDEKISVTIDNSVGRVRYAAEKVWASHHVSAEDSRSIHVPLCHAGRIVGMGVLDVRRERIDRVQAAAEDAAPLVATLLVEAELRHAEQRRLRTLELQNDLFRHMRGADSPQALTQRFARRVATTFGFDHASIRRAGSELTTEGRPIGFDGVEEVIALSALSDPRFTTGDMVKKRIGTLIVFSIDDFQFCFASSREGVVGLGDVEVLRELANDLIWATSTPLQHAGVLTGDQFRSRMSQPGVLALIEITNRSSRPADELASTSARILDSALRTLPAHAATMVRPDGDVLVHLPGATLGTATEWGARVIHGIAGVRLRTASLWPRTNAIIGLQETEPADLLAQSNG